MDIGGWEITADATGGFDICHHCSGVRLKDCRPAIRCQKSQTLTSSSCRCSEQSLIFDMGGQLSLAMQLSVTGADWLTVSARIKNTTTTALSIDEITLLCCAATEGPTRFDRVLPNAKDMCGRSWLSAADGDTVSSCVFGLTAANGDIALVSGFTDLSDAFYRFDITNNNANISFSAVCQREGIALDAGCELAISALVVGAGRSLSKLMDDYAAQTADVMGFRDNEIATGWCSWYYYYDTATEEDIDRNIQALAASDLKDKVRVIQIDDGWNLPAPDAARIWGDWQAGGMFPKGMKELADRIQAKGFVPGLWLAPFSVDPASTLYKEHPDWMIQQGGKPIDFYGVSALDLSHPGAIDFVAETFDRVFNKWGFEYIKIDFLLHAVLVGERYDRTKTTAELLRRGLQAIRQVAGDRFILCCGCPVGPAVGICDGMRVGYDVSSRWDVKVNLDEWPLGNLNIRAAAMQSAWRQWMHRRWWQNDPDCLVVRDYGSTAEKKTFETSFPEFQASPPYGLSDQEASCWSQFVWFTGGMALISEDMTALSGDRYALLVRNFPPNTETVRWVDWYQDPEVVVMQSNGPKNMIGVFNFSDRPVSLSIPADKLNLNAKWGFVERLSLQWFEGSGAVVRFPELAAHAGCVWFKSGNKD